MLAGGDFNFTECEADRCNVLGFKPSEADKEELMTFDSLKRIRGLFGLEQHLPTYCPWEVDHTPGWIEPTHTGMWHGNRRSRHLATHFHGHGLV